MRKPPSKTSKRRISPSKIPDPVNMRFFFTASDEQMAEFIYLRCEDMGLMPYEYIRSIIRREMKK